MVVKHPTLLLPLFLALQLILSCSRGAYANDTVELSSDDSSDDSDANSSRKKIHEEEDEIGYIQSLIVNTPAVATVKSSYQEIEVYDSDHFGKVFVLDGCLQLTERDAPHYNEMLAHVPVMEYLARHTSEDINDPMRVLVVGGGDGYVVSELLKYPQIGSIDHVELDQEVINVAKQHLPWGHSWEDGKVNLVVGDGAAFVKEQANDGQSYHVIVQDSSDPFWLDADGSVTTLPSSVLYDASHFESLYKLLQPTGGVLMFQAETYNIPSNLESIRKWRKLLKNLGFKTPRYGSISISTYPTGQIGFFSAHALNEEEGENVCKSDEACNDSSPSVILDTMDTLSHISWDQILARFNELDGKTLYYHPRIHRSSYDLPLWVEEYLYGSGTGE